MASILYIGMDVHTTNHTVCAYKIGADDVFAETSFAPLAENIAVYLETLRYNEPSCEVNRSMLKSGLLPAVFMY